MEKDGECYCICIYSIVKDTHVQTHAPLGIGVFIKISSIWSQSEKKTCYNQNEPFTTALQ